MDVYERSRHELQQRLQEAIGAEAAGTLMAHLPPVGYSELATKSDLKALEEKLLGTEERLGLRMEAMRQQLRAEMHQMARSLVLTMTTVMAFLLGVLFAALQVAG